MDKQRRKELREQFNQIKIYMGVYKITNTVNGKIFVGSSPNTVAMDLVRTMVDEDSSVISIYYGEDHSAEEAEKLGNALQNDYPDCEVEVYSGGQPLYYYIVSVE